VHPTLPDSRLPTPDSPNPTKAKWYDRLTLLLYRVLRSSTVVEPLLSGIVLGLIPVTLAGLFVAAYLQYRRGNQFDL